MTQSRKKSYACERRIELEFEVGDWVYFKISPMKVVMRFGKKVKLSPPFVGPYQIDESNFRTDQHPNLKIFLSSCKTQFQEFKQDVLNSATQDSIMSVYKKTKTTHAYLKHLLKDLSCDTLLPKILKLTILFTNASSSST